MKRAKCLLLTYLLTYLRLTDYPSHRVSYKLTKNVMEDVNEKNKCSMPLFRTYALSSDVSRITHEPIYRCYGLLRNKDESSIGAV